MSKTALHIAAAQLQFRQTIEQNVDLIRERIVEAARGGCDVVLFPECAVTGYNVDFRRIPPRAIEAALDILSAVARSARIHVLLGTPTFEGRRRFNSLVHFDRQGRERFRYHKVHLTPRDAESFRRGNALAFFHLDGIACTAMICHERRYPELVRLPVMMGAQIVFHPNAGLDALEVSRKKRRGRDGIAARAFENQIYYVFANSVGAQGDGLWSAGDSKIIAPDSSILALANNRSEALIHARIDLSKAGRKYAREALEYPAFLRPHWKALLKACRNQTATS